MVGLDILQNSFHYCQELWSPSRSLTHCLCELPGAYNIAFLLLASVSDDTFWSLKAYKIPEITHYLPLMAPMPPWARAAPVRNHQATGSASHTANPSTGSAPFPPLFELHCGVAGKPGHQTDFVGK